ncbi:hypothetical protein [Vibrio sp. 99-8-1]|uniref:hypothetical protein n=1 Tax=Vibrio sp. 99-8-1 TaxID=2607602 RepID=UPI001493B100|nr:hypothetical protein [Vibrio sp. 99-8-1]NOI66922.1 hypothetical protein [Vibrio sp. 99-8-1]
MSTEIDRQDELNETAAFEAAVSEVEGGSSDGLSAIVNEPHTQEESNDNKQHTSDDTLDDGHVEHARSVDVLPKDADDNELEKLQSENRRLNHSLSSQIGRTKAAEGRWKKAQEQLGKLKEAGADMDSLSLVDEEFAEDYPDLAEVMGKTMTKSLGAVQEQLNSITEPLQTIVDGQVESIEETRDAQNQEAVLDAIPNAFEIVNNPAFDDWLSKQPSGVQNMAGGDDPQDAIYVLNQFNAQSPDNSIRKKRDNQLNALTSLPAGRGGPRNTELSADDEDALFAAAVKEIEG